MASGMWLPRRAAAASAASSSKVAAFPPTVTIVHNTAIAVRARIARSEEHTSELQSPMYLLFPYPTLFRSGEPPPLPPPVLRRSPPSRQPSRSCITRQSQSGHALLLALGSVDIPQAEPPRRVARRAVVLAGTPPIQYLGGVQRIWLHLRPL